MNYKSTTLICTLNCYVFLKRSFWEGQKEDLINGEAAKLPKYINKIKRQHVSPAIRKIEGNDG